MKRTEARAMVAYLVREHSVQDVIEWLRDYCEERAEDDLVCGDKWQDVADALDACPMVNL